MIQLLLQVPNLSFLSDELTELPLIISYLAYRRTTIRIQKNHLSEGRLTVSFLFFDKGFTVSYISYKKKLIKTTKAICLTSIDSLLVSQEIFQRFLMETASKKHNLVFRQTMHIH